MVWKRAITRKRAVARHTHTTLDKRSTSTAIAWQSMCRMGRNLSRITRWYMLWGEQMICVHDQLSMSSTFLTKMHKTTFPPHVSQLALSTAKHYLPVTKLYRPCPICSFAYNFLAKQANFSFSQFCSIRSAYLACSVDENKNKILMDEVIVSRRNMDWA